MAQTINTNISSLNAQRNLNTSQSSLATSLQRLSTGLRINSAKDDAAGMAISSRMTSQINGMNQAARNANDAISLAQTAEGDQTQISNNLQRIRELAVQASNASNSASDRQALNSEVSSLIAEIDRVATTSAFNGVKLLNGSFTNQSFQVGANAGETITVGNLSSARATDLGGYKVTTATAVDNSAIAAGDLTVNSVAVGASVAGAGAGQTAISAWAKAAAINSANAGVYATASTTVAGAAGTAATAGDIVAVSINGFDTALVTDTGTLATDKASMVNAINDISDKTGVTAAIVSGNIDLTAADGRAIAVALSSNGAVTGALADVGLAAATTQGTLTLVSASPTITIGGTNGTGRTGLSASNVGTLNAISAIDISTASGAQSSLSMVDAALQQLNSSRANLGALQNRFSAVVTSLQTASENISASRSRIQDADFASETANLTRSQILQQAGTAMLAQANALPQNVLTLLRG
ncbi:MAG: flagellin [Azonexaceae bacterium]|nr:flagellin [Azonexaceae bacterium]